MGLVYKAYQSLAYFGLEWSREIGKEVDKQRQRERTNKLYEEAREMVDYEALDNHWNNLLQECWEWSEVSIKKPDKKSIKNKG